MVEQLQEEELLPESMLADTAYGSDGNVPFAEAMDVELVSPVAGPKGEEKAEETSPTADAVPALEPWSIDDLAIDERTGELPLKVWCLTVADDDDRDASGRLQSMSLL